MRGTETRHSDDRLQLDDRPSSADIARTATDQVLDTLRALGFGVTLYHADGSTRCTARRAGKFVGSSAPGAEGDADAAYRCVVQLCVALTADVSVVHPRW